MVTEIITFPAELRVDDVIRHAARAPTLPQHELPYFSLQ